MCPILGAKSECKLLYIPSQELQLELYGEDPTLVN